MSFSETGSKKKLYLPPGVYSDMKLVYMCRTGFKNGGLRERHLSEKGGGGEGFQSGHSREKQWILELK